MKLIIFGTGNAAHHVVPSITIPIAYYVDNNEKLWGSQFRNSIICSPSEILNEHKDNIFILIASSYVSEISEQLSSMGLIKGKHFVSYVEAGSPLSDRRMIYSQEGEELVLQRLFNNKKMGFFVDIGAHHPIRFSNSYYFYRLGWRGINIDPVPGMKRMFDLIRPEDINLEIGISNLEGYCKYYIFNEFALNTFDAKKAAQVLLNENYYLQEERNVPVLKLSTVMDTYANGRTIDFLSIDTEGLDLLVLQSNDWLKYKPEVILVEILQSSLSEVHSSSIHQYLLEQGYLIKSMLLNTCIYQKKV